MTDTLPVADGNRRIYSSNITADNRITDRCLRKWIVLGRFPLPDGNLNGRNFWLEPTYKRWQGDVLAGRYSQRRRPGARAPTEPVAA